MVKKILGESGRFFEEPVSGDHLTVSRLPECPYVAKNGDKSGLCRNRTYPHFRVLGSSAPLKPQGGRITLRIVADVSSIEVFANGGRIVMSFSLPIDPKNTSLSLFATGGEATVESMTVWQCKPIWPQ